MNYTTNFNLAKPEGTDLYNHLTIDNPNMDTIDGAMQANKLASVGAATELVSGTVHAISRSDNNQNIFKFKATGDFKAGDTVTVDGVSVNAFTTSGEALQEDAYVLSAEVICILDGSSLWVLTNKRADNEDIAYSNSTYLPGVTNNKEALDYIGENSTIKATDYSFYAAAGVTIGSRNRISKRGHIALIDTVLVFSANKAADDPIIGCDDVDFGLGAYIMGRNDDGTTSLFYANTHVLRAFSPITAGTVVRLGQIVYVG